MELDLAFVDQTLDRLGRNPDRILPVLQVLQRHYRYLPGEALRHVARHSDITLAQIASVSTFYSQFRHRPVGRNLISVCNGTACHVKGAERVYDVLRDYFKIRAPTIPTPPGSSPSKRSSASVAAPWRRSYGAGTTSSAHSPPTASPR